MSEKAILVILDGWGQTQDPTVSAVHQANTPFFDSLIENYPHTTLRTDGEHVGLPVGQMGNSEVGHLNLGAGRIVYQDLAKINMAVDNNTLISEPVLQQAFNYAKENDKPVHFIGLVSDGGVHSHINHLKGLLRAAKEFGVSKKYVHAFTDGRDVDPKSGLGHVQDLIEELPKTDAKLASVIGRYYAMDRDRRWERTKKAYDLLVNGIGEKTENPLQAMQKSYDKDISDEFIEPISVLNNGVTHKVEKGDVVIFFNFRTDRGRQLTHMLTQEDNLEFDSKRLPLYFVTMTKYDDSFANINVIYEKSNIKATLGETLSYMGKKQIRAAETEKYPHVTFFFSGGREEPFSGEERILVASPKVATYDLKPEMSAVELTDKLVEKIEENKTDFFCINYANPDMVGHTGSIEAAIIACETVDKCLERIVTAGKENYNILILADHGNSEKMKNEDGSENTAHTTFPVPFILVTEDKKLVKSGILGDIAPTILDLMQINKPELMTQHSLLV
ncbi:2,3-bisphosphoglycerate-independent phosphoglycerate mutase [Mesonia sp. K7]|uniref:2,3-bisphosphoglycerate-independent phosphoglycerate mutase n=1 Tax=Mesonia sp. K7 TaxID=2218606 RepID=UPI000DA7FC98|nr:2,3-bisphosphoglycerate-independent phosphoglycerate mutase [Mesonia sp. K7]PZD79686.1 2,3-bisphosphoglycerate-independent phosphoglycerate mutase [Mesonia sp. K7]